jgi:Peptidase family M28/PDZ domain/PA domain
MTLKLSLFSQRSRIASFTSSLILFFAFGAWTLEIPSLPLSPADALKSHVRYLASDELTGRGVDTPGIKLARDYIAREFAKYGLHPGGDKGSYFQGFEVTTGVEIKQPTALVLDNGQPLTLNEEWTPLALSQSGKAEGDVVFAGYGITAKDYGYDDYAGIDAKGKIVIVLRYEPPPKDDKSPFQKAPRYSTHAALRTKANNARDHGATGLILVDVNRTAEGNKELLSTRSGFSRDNNGIVAVQVKRQVLERWLQDRAVSLAELKSKIDRNEKPASIPLSGAKVSLSVTLEPIRQRTENVVGILPGSDSRLRDEALVIGAHYDHLGLGYFGTRDSRMEGQIHHGADDNASGTAVLLGVAEHLAHSSPNPARSIIFVAFSGEELGLFGSRYFVDHPPFPLSATKGMLNLDMVGRLRDNRVTVFGTRSAKELSDIVTSEAHRLGLEVRESDGIGRSDNISFYNKKIPALHFFTGSHPDYHRPTDTWDKINPEGMVKVSELVLATTQRIANAATGLNFVNLPSQPRSNTPGETRSYGAYLGSIPDMDDSGAGVRLAGVSDGSPAALAGLRQGDIIVEFAGSKVRSLEDLADLLGSKKPGDEVDITVLRAGQPLTLKATLRARS